jgi:hypothetical protein
LLYHVVVGDSSDDSEANSATMDHVTDVSEVYAVIVVYVADVSNVYTSSLGHVSGSM